MVGRRLNNSSMTNGKGTVLLFISAAFRKTLKRVARTRLLPRCEGRRVQPPELPRTLLGHLQFRIIAKKLNRGLGVFAFKTPECNVPARAFTVRLKIEEQD